MGPTELWQMIAATLGQVAHNRRTDPRFRRGQEQYSVWAVLKIFLLCVLKGISARSFYSRLEQDGSFRRQYGLPNKLVSRSEFYKRLKTSQFMAALWELFTASGAKALRGLGSEEVRVVAMDLTRVESRSGRDPCGAWGFDSRGPFFGYKLGLIISSEGVVLGMSLMKANGNEFWVQGRLLRLARRTIQTAYGKVAVEYLVCDSGFDGEPVYRTSRQQLKSAVLCPPRRKRNPRSKGAQSSLWYARKRTPHRFRNQALWARPESRKIYAQRTQIERVNGQLKDNPLRLAEVPRCRRGVTRLLPLCLAKIILYNFALNVNIAEGQQIRAVEHLVA